MSLPRPLLVLAAVALVVGGVAWGPTATGEGETPRASAATSNEPSVSVLHWESPLDLEGDFVAVFKLETDQRNFCRETERAEGTVRDDDPSLLLFVRRWRQESPRASGFTFMNQETVSAHAAGTLDTRPVLGMLEDGKWSSGHLGGSAFGGPRFPNVLYITVAAFSLENRVGGAPRPMTIDIVCDHPVELSIFAGRHAVDLTRQTLKDGGTGASVGSQTWPAAYVESREEEVFDASKVWLQADFDPDWVSPQAVRGVTYAQFDLHHPAGTEHWQSVIGPDEQPNALDDIWMTFDGPGGEYTFEMTLAGTERENRLMGILAGLNPVESLDEVV